jgi:DNA topoisomerase-1
MTTAATPGTTPSCPAHGATMVLRHGRSGEFWGCREYPRCTHTAPQGIGVLCPRCSAPIVERRAKKTGRAFWPCGNRACSFVAWERPHACSACGAGCFGAERPRLEPDAMPDPAISPGDDREVPF